MRIILSIFLIIISTWSFAGNDVAHFRTLFQNASSESDFERILKTESEGASATEINIIEAYKAVAHATMAKYAFNPYSKMKYFNEGRDQLEALIVKDKSVDNVFLRLILQLNTPDFLNYNNEIEQDLKYFIAQVNTAGLTPDHKAFMIETILEGKKDDPEFRDLFDILEGMNDIKI